MHVEVIKTEELGDRSYVVHDGHAAVVIDPQRDLDRVAAVLERCAVPVSLVLETHIHNDYVTGGYELAQRAGAAYGVSARDDVQFDRLPVGDGDELSAGSLRVTALHTPGHTENHLAYVVDDPSAPQDPPAVFTGGSLQFGSVGRTDLVDPERTVPLTHAQYRSARRLAALLPDAAAVFPTHGFGSFCSAGSAPTSDESTIGKERSGNDALTTDQEQFVKTLIANLTPYPAYYAHMGPINRRGPRAVPPSLPRPVDPAELGARIAAGEWVVDLRNRTAFAADHVGGTVGVELASDFATYVGWLIPWGAPITLIGASGEQLADAQRQLIRIGVDRLAAAAHGPLDEIAGDHERRSYPTTDFAGARRRIGTGEVVDVVLDVRRADERDAGFIAGSANLPIHELPGRIGDAPDGRLWVHCASGYRASVAASLLDRAGRDVVLIDDEFDNAAKAGFALTNPR